VLHVPLHMGGIATLAVVAMRLTASGAAPLVGTRSVSVPSTESAKDVEAGEDTRTARSSCTPRGYGCSRPQQGLRQGKNRSGAAVSYGDAADTKTHAACRCIALPLRGAGWGKLGLFILFLFAMPLWSCCTASFGVGGGEVVGRGGAKAFAEHQRQIARPYAIRAIRDPIHELDGDPKRTCFADTSDVVGGTVGGIQATGGGGGANEELILRPSGTLDVTQKGAAHGVVTLCENTL
jgi:hypothetical protein